MRARHKKKMLKKAERYTGVRKGNMERLWHFRQTMWRDGERVYTWENSPGLHQKILDENRYYEVEDRDWWECAYLDAEMIGILITGHDQYFYPDGKLIDGTAIESIELVLANHGEECDTYRTAAEYKALLLADMIKRRCLDEDDWEIEDEYLAAQYLKKMLRLYRDHIQGDYEYYTSDDCLEELFKEGDYEFDSDGRIL
jgi:hypothetical protein